MTHTHFTPTEQIQEDWDHRQPYTSKENNYNWTKKQTICIDIIHSFGGEPTLLALHQCLFNNVLGLKYKLLLLVVALIIIIGSFGGPIIHTGIRHFDEVSADKRSI